MPKKNYDPKLIDIAVQEVKNGNSYRKVSIKYGVPKSTIEFKIKNPGHRESCVTWILDSAKKGFPRKKYDIVTSVQKFLTDNPRQNPFKDNRPGDGWLKAFLKRHPEIAERTSEAVSYTSACVTEKDIRKWFLEVDNNVQQEKKTSFTKYLPYPDVPERKGQRQTERLPFAITSQTFQEICREKQEKVDRLNREKEERKRKREESKLNKANTKKKTGPSKQLCYVCKGVIHGTNKILLQCDLCNNNFHKKCVPQSHHIHISSEEEDKYVCHNCYREESESASENNDSDVEVLYNMYLNESKTLNY